VAVEAERRTPAQVAEAALASFATRDPDLVAANAHPDGVDDVVAIGEFRGRDAIREFYEETFRAFPDFEMRVERIIADDAGAAVRWVATGTFVGGPFQGILPTGRRIELRGVDYMEISDGLIRRNTIFYDGASFARAIGMLPGRDSAGERALLAVFNVRVKLRSLLRRRRASA
jgi:steroid delta-isomerase-like uncharacterized protein